MALRRRSEVLVGRWSEEILRRSVLAGAGLYTSWSKKSSLGKLYWGVVGTNQDSSLEIVLLFGSRVSLRMA